MGKKRIALLLGGGGARGAYQAGILKSWQPIFDRNPQLDIVSGVSAGSINAAKIMESAHDLGRAPEELEGLWSQLSTTDVYESGFRAVIKNLVQLTRTSRSTGHESTNISHSILNTQPLYQYLVKNLNMGKVHDNLKKFPHMAFSVNCFDYTDMKNTAFYQTQRDIPNWERPTRRGVSTNITVKHIIASCSVPLIFPTISIEDHYYGDGSLRNLAPLNPLIKMGADKIICIHLRGKSHTYKEVPSLANVAGAVYESMFLDSIEYDSQILNRINILSNFIPDDEKVSSVVDLCRISPLIDFGEIAERFRRKFPRSLHHTMGGWISSELLSFLLFDADYSAVLMDQGFQDGKLYYDIVEDWLLDRESK